MRNTKLIVGMMVAMFGMLDAFSATFYVATTGNDDNAGTSEAPFLTIQKALDSLTSENCYQSKIIIRSGTYKIDSELVPNSGTFEFTVQSETGNPSDVTIDAQGSSRCFNCVSSAATIISFVGLTFINGCASDGNGGGIYATANCSFDDCVVSNCTATGNGGGITANGTLKYLSNVRIENCTASTGGGACFQNVTDGITNCCVYNCSSDTEGGGIRLQYGAAVMTDCVISNCFTTADNGQGGGLNCLGYGSELKNVTILDCSSQRYGGGAWVGSYEGATTIDGMVVSNCTLSGTATGNRYGAGLYLNGDNSEEKRIQAKNVVIGNCHVLNQSDQNVYGAGLYAYRSDCRNFTIADCSIVDNELTTIPSTVFCGGGAMLNDASLYDSVVTNCVLSRQNNTRQDSTNGKADGERGGGVYAVYNTGVSEEYRPVISNCVIACCAATNAYNGIGQGGGVYLTGSQTGGPLLCDSLITGNRAGQYGAGAFVAQGNKGTIARCKFTDNEIAPDAYQMSSSTSLADIGGGGTAIGSLGTVDITGCLIKGNRGTVPGSYLRYNSAIRFQNNTNTMTDCVLEGNYGYQYGSALAVRAISGLVVSNCVFRGNACESWGGVIYAASVSADNALIADSYITGNASTNSLMYFDATANAGAAIRLRNSLVYDNVCPSVMYYKGTKTDLDARVIVENCTVVSNQCSSITFSREYADNAICMEFVGSVILFNKNSSVFSTYQTNVSYCCSSQFRDPVDESNVLYDSSKPLFMDLASWDFRPAKGSQLCNRVAKADWMGDGTKTSALDMGSGFEVASVGKYGVTVNRLNAVPRYLDSAAEIGCCEYQSALGIILIVR